jgi:hypothetical protein
MFACCRTKRTRVLRGSVSTRVHQVDKCRPGRGGNRPTLRRSPRDRRAESTATPQRNRAGAEHHRARRGRVGRREERRPRQTVHRRRVPDEARGLDRQRRLEEPRRRPLLGAEAATRCDGCRWFDWNDGRHVDDGRLDSLHGARPAREPLLVSGPSTNGPSCTPG